MNKNFEEAGYFEEVFETLTGKCLGTRDCPHDPHRPCGYNGRRDFTVMENITLRRGHKDIVVKASKRKPLALYSFQQIKCGRALYDPRKGYQK